MLTGCELTRRRFLQGVGVTAGSFAFTDVLGLRAEELKKQGRAVILLWMQGGPSQLETFDPKPATENGGPTRSIATSVPGIEIAQTWAKTAEVMQELAVIRSMTNREGNHRRATYQLHTGYIPSGSIKHPSLAANVAHQIADRNRALPPVVSVGQTIGAGFLGVDYDPFVVTAPGTLPRNVSLPVTESRYSRRLGLLNRLETDFAAQGGKTIVDTHQRLYNKTSKMVLSTDVQAFDISSEPAQLREAYGDSEFGRGCLLARRLVESGVTFVEVRSNGWDTHDNNFDRTNTLSEQVDPALGALITDLKTRGLLDTTLVVWMGEFGRTPRINPRTGRDHFPRVFSAALAGAGIRGGQVIGKSSADGMEIADRPVTVDDLFCSVCRALNIDPRTEHVSPLGRPLKIVDSGNVVEQLFS